MPRHPSACPATCANSPKTGADQSLNVGSAKAQSCHICTVVVHDQDGDSQHAAVGGDQGQVNAQRVVQGHDILLEEDLDELHQHGDDQNKHDGLQIAQLSRIQNEDLDSRMVRPTFTAPSSRRKRRISPAILGTA